MSWTRRRLQVATAVSVVVAWAMVYIGIITFAPPAYDPAGETAAKVNRELAVLLAIPTALYVVAALLLLHYWLAGAGARLASMDPPGRLLAAVVATLPERRRDWGAAMTAELAEVQGRSARWWFALSCARATLRLPSPGGPVVLVCVAGVAVAATVAVGPVVGAVVPGLGVFATSLVGLLSALLALAVARGRRVRFPVPLPTVVVVGGVVAAITLTVVLLLREPSAAEHLPPSRAVFLAAVLSACLWAAVTYPRLLGATRLAPHLGAASALLYGVAVLVAVRVATDPGIGQGVRGFFTLIVGILIFVGPAAHFFLPALASGIADSSFRSGVRAGVWTTIASLPLAFALSVHESLRIYTNGGGVGFDHVAGPVGAILDDAVFWPLIYGPVVGVPCAILGAAFGARLRALPSPPR